MHRPEVEEALLILKRSQASRVINDLRLIDGAVDMYAIENNKADGAAVPVAEWTNYNKAGTNLHRTGNDLLGNPHHAQTVDVIPKGNSTAYNALSDVAFDPFWSPYH